MNNFKNNLSNPTIQQAIRKTEAIKQSAFLAGAAWAFEQLDIAHPEWELQTLVPKLLENLKNVNAEKQLDPTPDAGIIV